MSPLYEAGAVTETRQGQTGQEPPVVVYCGSLRSAFRRIQVQAGRLQLLGSMVHKPDRMQRASRPAVCQTDMGVLPLSWANLSNHRSIPLL